MERQSNLKNQVKKDLLAYIQSMNLEKNNKLPSEEKLSVMLGVSRVTIRSALKELEMEGRIFSRHGSGTYVNPMARKIVYNFAIPELYENIIKQSGSVPCIRLEGVYLIPADDEAVTYLNVEPGSEMVAVKKTFFSDHRFSMYCIDYFPREQLTKEQVQSFTNTEFSSFEYLLRYKGRKAMWDSIQIQVTDNHQFPEINSLAGLPADTWKSFLLIKGVNYDKTDTPFIYSNSYIDPDVVEYRMIRRKQYRYKNL